MSVSAQQGGDLLLLADPGTGYEPIGEQQSFSIDKSRDTIDTTTKQDDHKKFEYGKMEKDISVDALQIPTTQDRDAQAKLEQALDQANPMYLRYQEDGSTIKEVEVLVESKSIEAEQNSAVTMSFNFVANEFWTEV